MHVLCSCHKVRLQKKQNILFSFCMVNISGCKYMLKGLKLSTFLIAQCGKYWYQIFIRWKQRVVKFKLPYHDASLIINTG